MLRNAMLAGVGPSAVRELNRTTLVAGLHTLAVPAVGPESEPQRVLEAARPHVGLNPGTAGLAVGVNPMKTIGQQVAALATENDDRRKSGAALKVLRVVVDHLRVDGNAHLRARIKHEAVERQRLANGNASRQLRRNARRIGTLFG